MSRNGDRAFGKERAKAFDGGAVGVLNDFRVLELVGRAYREGGISFSGADGLGKAPKNGTRWRERNWDHREQTIFLNLSICGALQNKEESRQINLSGQPALPKPC